MKIPNGMRQWHRWLSIAFTLAVTVNVAAQFSGFQSIWLGLMNLIPLVMLMVTGLTLFFAPWFRRRASA